MLNSILDISILTHLNICAVIKTLLAASPLTRTLEQSYSKLAKVCCTDRNMTSSANLETLYLQAALKEAVVIDSDTAQKLLEKTKVYLKRHND